MPEIPEEGMCLEPFFEKSPWTIRCTLPYGHESEIHRDEDNDLSWGKLSAVDAIVKP